jgi:hypothetical protein
VETNPHRAKGNQPLMVRVQPRLHAQIHEWAETHGGVSLPEAMRQLAEIGLALSIAMCTAKAATAAVRASQPAVRASQPAVERPKKDGRALRRNNRNRTTGHRELTSPGAETATAAP